MITTTDFGRSIGWRLRLAATAVGEGLVVTSSTPYTVLGGGFMIDHNSTGVSAKRCRPPR